MSIFNAVQRLEVVKACSSVLKDQSLEEYERNEVTKFLKVFEKEVTKQQTSSSSQSQQRKITVSSNKKGGNQGPNEERKTEDQGDMAKGRTQQDLGQKQEI